MNYWRSRTISVRRMFEIISYYNKTVLYKSETATTAIRAISEAVSQAADLQGADLRGATCKARTWEARTCEARTWEARTWRGANLRGANLRRRGPAEARTWEARTWEARSWEGANLVGAKLEGAKGLLSKPVTPLQIGGSRHWILVRQDGYLTIGCVHRPLAEWEERYEAIGRLEHYTDAEVQEYRAHIAHCRAWMELHGVVNVIEPTAETASTGLATGER